MTDTTSTADVLFGAVAIAQYLGLDKRAVLHMKTSGQLPVFKIGRRLAARRATLDAFLSEREASGTGGWLERRLSVACQPKPEATSGDPDPRG